MTKEMITIIFLWILLSIIAVIVILLHFSINASISVDKDGLDFKVKYMFFTIYPRKKKEKKRRKKRKSTKSRKIKTRKEKHSKQVDLLNDDIESDFSDFGLTDDISDEVDTINENDTLDDEKTLSKTEPKLDKSKDNLESSFQENLSEKNSDGNKSQDKKTKVKKSKPKKKKKERIKSKKKSKSEKGKLASLREKYEKLKPYLPMGWKYFKKLLKTIRFTDTEIEVNVGREDAHEAAIYYGIVQGALFNFLGTLASIFTFKIKKADVNCDFTQNKINGSLKTVLRVRMSTMIAIAFCIVVNFLFIILKRKFSKNRDIKNKQKDKDENQMNKTDEKVNA